MSDKTIYPQNDKKTYYAPAYYTTLQELIDIAQNRFGKDVDLADIEVEHEHFHARCIGYDLYDSCDYDDYIVLRHMT